MNRDRVSLSSWHWAYKGLFAALLEKIDMHPFKLSGEPTLEVEVMPDREAVKVTVHFEMVLK